MTDDDIPERLVAAARSVSPSELPSGAELRNRVRTRRFRRRVGFGASLVVVAGVVTTLAFQLPGGARPQKVTLSQGTASPTSRPTTAASSPSTSASTRPASTTTVPAGAKCRATGGSRLHRNPGRCGHAARPSTNGTAPNKVVTSALVLPSAVIRVGSTMHAIIEIDNRTGHAIHDSGCGSPFQVLLTNASHAGNPAWSLCLREFTIPTGRSTFKVVIAASYNFCGGPGTPGCPSQGLPALPSGRYKATTYESGHVLPVPAPQPVRIIP